MVIVFGLRGFSSGIESNGNVFLLFLNYRLCSQKSQMSLSTGDC